MKIDKILTAFGFLIFFCLLFIFLMNKATAFLPVSQMTVITAGPNSPGTNAGWWNNVDNDKTSNDQYASSQYRDAGDTTDYLKATNFGFSIPANAVIDGISVNVERKANEYTFFDDAVRIIKSGTIGTTDRSKTTPWSTTWPTTDATVTYGSASDLWGQTWTAADINSANFGFAISAKVGRRMMRTAYVDWINITVAYHMPAPTPPAGMVYIPAGTFMMGAVPSLPPGESVADSSPQHSATLSAFYMDQTEMTKAKWDEIATWASANGYDISNSSAIGKAANYPVSSVTWYNVVKWCNARSQKEGLTPVYYTDANLTLAYKSGSVSNPYVNWNANGYRLPTEAEWEYAGRGGTPGHRFSWSNSDEIQHTRANYRSIANFAYDTSLTRGYHPVYSNNHPNDLNGGTPYTSPVGSFASNGYGLYDTTGNVYEWVWDWYDSAYYSSSPSTNPHGPATGSVRAIRGGSWSKYAVYSRVEFRASNPQDGNGAGALGFRTVRNYVQLAKSTSNGRNLLAGFMSVTLNVLSFGTGKLSLAIIVIILIIVGLIFLFIHKKK